MDGKFHFDYEFDLSIKKQTHTEKATTTRKNMVRLAVINIKLHKTSIIYLQKAAQLIKRMTLINPSSREREWNIVRRLYWFLNVENVFGNRVAYVSLFCFSWSCFCVFRRANEISRLRYESFHVKNTRTMINLISLSWFGFGVHQFPILWNDPPSSNRSDLTISYITRQYGMYM